MLIGDQPTWRTSVARPPTSITFIVSPLKAACPTNKVFRLLAQRLARLTRILFALPATCQALSGSAASKVTFQRRRRLSPCLPAARSPHTSHDRHVEDDYKHRTDINLAGERAVHDAQLDGADKQVDEAVHLSRRESRPGSLLAGARSHQHSCKATLERMSQTPLDLPTVYRTLTFDARLQQRRPSAAATSGPSRWSGRLDSVYAMYAEMYPELDEEAPPLPTGFTSHEDERGTTLLSTYTTSATYSVSYSPASGTKAAPWDERGATGLYGGGGRGADDHETGWARNFAFAPPPPLVSGVEEDLRFEGDTAAAAATTPLGSPVTLDPPRIARTPSPVNSASGHLSDTAHSASSIRRAREEQAEQAASLQQESAEQPVALPVHTIDVAQIKKQQAVSSIPTPSEPILSAKYTTKSRPKLPRTPSLKWRSRSSKKPTISTPILPPGFVESLGMATFPLAPQPGGDDDKKSQLAPIRESALESKSMTPAPVASTTARTLTPPRTPSFQRELARNPKLSPVGFSRESVTAESTELPPAAAAAATAAAAVIIVESDEANRGQRVQVNHLPPMWTESELESEPAISFEVPLTSLQPAHERTESSGTFRDPWATVTASSSSARSQSDTSMRYEPSSWTAAKYHPPPPRHHAQVQVEPLSTSQRFRQDSVASRYSEEEAADHHHAPSSTLRPSSSQALNFVRRGENTYSFASLSPSTCGPEDTVPSSWRFPPPSPLSPTRSVGVGGMSGFRNPFS